MTLQLGTQTHFGQGWNPALLEVAEHLGADAIRDGLPWARIETAPGVFDFSMPQAAWLDAARASGTPVMLTFAHSNPLYDGGFTIHTDAGRAAFARFVAATLERFPNVTAIEIGNEYNSNSFVTGPIAAASSALRDDYYAKLVAAVDEALDAANIEVELVGGATHSIPVDYFADLKALGALDHMDAVSIHPYSTPPEQFEDQIAVLRAVIGDDMPIRVTEFGSNFASPDDAPAYLVKMISVMGAAGIESASWYALARQAWFPNMELWNQTATAETAAGRTFALLDSILDDAATIARLETDDFTYLYTLGDHAAVIWGTNGRVTLAGGVRAYDLAGNPIPNFDGHISADVPIILRSSAVITSNSVQFAQTSLVADSFDQFDVSNAPGGTSGFEGPWSYFAESGTGRVIPLYTMGGGLRAGEVWTPYLGTTWLRPLSVNATSVTPADFAAGRDPAARYAVVERYTAGESGVFTLTGHYDVSDATRDGITISIRINGTTIQTQRVYNTSNGHQYDFSLEHVALTAGDSVDFIVSSGRNAAGDVTARRIQITAEEPLRPSGSSGDFSGAASAVFADLAKGEVTIGNQLRQFSASTLWGSAHGDRLYGDAANNIIYGAGGEDRLYGRDGQDHLLGGAGDDRLDGGGGADLLEGGSGNDIYFVDHAGDRAVEQAGDGNTDTVYTVVTYALGDHVERLLLGGSAAISGTGNSLDNVIKGNSGSNTIRGNGGADRLWGGAGADSFVFEHLEGPRGKDFIADFVSGQDVITLDRVAFSALAELGAGRLTTLPVASHAATSDQHLFYDPFTATLYYDSDGSGSALASAVVSFRAGVDLQAGDILLI